MVTVYSVPTFLTASSAMLEGDIAALSASWDISHKSMAPVAPVTAEEIALSAVETTHVWPALPGTLSSNIIQGPASAVIPLVPPVPLILQPALPALSVSLVWAVPAVTTPMFLSASSS